jgi:hypothetical protein
LLHAELPQSEEEQTVKAPTTEGEQLPALLYAQHWHLHVEDIVCAHVGLMTGLQEVAEVLAYDTDSVLLGQLVQGPSPGDSLYLPSKHWLHQK